MQWRLKEAGVCLSFLLVFANFATPQSTIQWQKSLGGTADDMVLSIRQTSDEGFIMGGVTASKDGDVTNSKGKGDLWVVKLDKNGTVSWKKTLGGSNEEQGCYLLPTSDGGYIVVGNTASNSGDVSGYHGGSSNIWGSGGYDIWVVKLTALGRIQWQRCLGGSKVDEVVTVKEVDNGYLLAGNTNSGDGDVHGQHGDYDIWLAKLSYTGSINWQRALGGPGTEKIRDLQIHNGTYLFAGYTTAVGGDVSGHHGNTDIWVGRISSTGILLWQKCLGGSKSESDFSNNVRPTSDGGFLVAGYTTSNDGDVTDVNNIQSGWIVKFGYDNSLQWQKTFAESDGIYGFHNAADGSSVFGTIFYVVSGNQKIGKPYIIKLAPDGSIVWSKEIHTTPLIVESMPDGGYTLFGHTKMATVPGYHNGYDAWMCKLDAGGNTTWEKAYGGSNNDFLQGRTAVYSGNTFPIHTSVNAPWNNYIPSIVAKDGGYFFTVSTGSNNGDVAGFHYSSKVGYRFDFWVVKLVPESATLASSVTASNSNLEQASPIFNVIVFPNPGRHSATFQFTAVEKGNVLIEFFNSSGSRMQTRQIASVQQGLPYQIRLNLSQFPAGNYFYRVKNGNATVQGKFIKVD